jgi:hypothetical protein
VNQIGGGSQGRRTREVEAAAGQQPRRQREQADDDAEHSQVTHEEPTVAQLDAALRAYVETWRALTRMQQAHSEARQQLASILAGYGLNGYVP